MLAVILNQHLIKKERAVKMQKQRIPPNPTTKQEILSLRRMGFPAQKKMEHMEKEIYARQKNLRKSNKQMAANHIGMPPPSRPFILLSRSSVSNMCKMHRRARRNNFKHFTVLVLAPFINCSCCYDDTDDYRRFHTTIDII